MVAVSVPSPTADRRRTATFPRLCFARATCYRDLLSRPAIATCYRNYNTRFHRPLRYIEKETLSP